MLIKAGTVITCNTNQAVLHNQGILIENGVIRAMDAWDQFSQPAGPEFLDATSFTLMPGLIDAHTHVVHSGDPDEDWQTLALTELTATTSLKAARNAYRHLEMGITTIRDVGAWDWVDIALRDAINAGWQPGPRMLVAGHGITSPGGHMDARKFARPGIPADTLATMGVIADGPDAARRAAWEQLMRGADLLKLNATLSEYVRAGGGQCSPEMTEETMQVICTIAHDTGRKVAAHCHGGPGVTAALNAGVDTFEHGRFLSDEQMERMAVEERFLVPTLSPEARRIEADDPPSDLATRRWYAMATDAMYHTVARAHEHGVPIVAGSDAGMPHVVHGGIAFEMIHLAEAGLSNGYVLASATRTAAQALGIGHEVGQVATDYGADLLLVDGNPAVDLTLLGHPKSIKMVLQHGKIRFDRRETIPSAT